MESDLGFGGALSAIDDDAPAFAKQAQQQFGNTAPVLPSVNYDDTETFLGEDNTPTAISALESPTHKGPFIPIQSHKKPVSNDTKTAILELLFINGIPASDINKAVLVSSIIEELVSYTTNSDSSLSGLSGLIQGK